MKKRLWRCFGSTSYYTVGRYTCEPLYAASYVPGVRHHGIILVLGYQHLFLSPHRTFATTVQPALHLPMRSHIGKLPDVFQVARASIMLHAHLEQ